MPNGNYGLDVSSFTSGFEALEKFIKKAPLETNRMITASILKNLNDLKTEINSNLDKNFYKSTSGSFQKSGRKFTQILRNSLATKTKEVKRPFSVEGLVGLFGAIYARVHEFGTTIKPKRKKFLTVPMQQKYVGHSAREFRNLTPIIWGAAGRLLDEKGDVAYLLLKRVEIPARPSVTPAFVAQKDNINKNIKTAVTEGLKNAQKK